MTTVSPDSIVSAGLDAALKFPMFTVCGLGISVYSAACAPQTMALQAMAAQARSRPRGIVFVVLSVAMKSSRSAQSQSLLAICSLPLFEGREQNQLSFMPMERNTGVHRAMSCSTNCLVLSGVEWR